MRRTFLLLTVFICLTEAYTSWDGEGTAADYFGTKIGKVKEAEYVVSKRLRRGIVGNDMLVGLRALKNLIKKARPYSRDDGVQYFLKAGDLATAVKDFRSMKPNAVRKYSTNVEVGTIGNRKVFIRKDDSRPTISISGPNENTVAISVVYNKS